MEIKRLAYSFYSPLLSPSVSGQHFHLSSYSVCDKNQHFCYIVFIHVLDSSRIRYTSAHKSGSDLSLLDTALQDAGIVEKTWVNIQGLRVPIHLRVGELIGQRKSPSYLGLYFPILCLLFRPYWVENLLAPFLLVHPNWKGLDYKISLEEFFPSYFAFMNTSPWDYGDTWEQDQSHFNLCTWCQAHNVFSWGTVVV